MFGLNIPERSEGDKALERVNSDSRPGENMRASAGGERASSIRLLFAYSGWISENGDAVRAEWISEKGDVLEVRMACRSENGEIARVAWMSKNGDVVRDAEETVTSTAFVLRPASDTASPKLDRGEPYIELDDQGPITAGAKELALDDIERSKWPLPTLRAGSDPEERRLDAGEIRLAEDCDR